KALRENGCQLAERQGKRHRPEVLCSILQLQGRADDTAARAVGGESEGLRHGRAARREDAEASRAARCIDSTGRQERGDEVGGVGRVVEIGTIAGASAKVVNSGV